MFRKNRWNTSIGLKCRGAKAGGRSFFTRISTQVFRRSGSVQDFLLASKASERTSSARSVIQAHVWWSKSPVRKSAAPREGCGKALLALVAMPTARLGSAHVYRTLSGSESTAEQKGIILSSTLRNAIQDCGRVRVPSQDTTPSFTPQHLTVSDLLPSSLPGLQLPCMDNPSYGRAERGSLVPYFVSGYLGALVVRTRRSMPQESASEEVVSGDVKWREIERASTSHSHLLRDLTREQAPMQTRISSEASRRTDRRTRSVSQAHLS